MDTRRRIEQLRAFFAAERRAPGYNEMLKLFGYRSKNAVYGVLRKLEEEGYLTKQNGKIAFTAKLVGKTKLLGTVRAGFPSPAEEELIDTLSLDEFLIEKPEATFLLKVTGDSMEGAGILPGDMVLVEKGRTAKSGDIVIAQVDGEWTMKRLVIEGKRYRLRPDSSKYNTITPRHSLEIAGVVRGVIRKFD
jgi:repressor LexA